MPLKHKSILYQLTLIVVFLCSNNNSVLADQHNEQPNILQSASELDYPPFAIVRPDGTADGFSVDLLKAVAKAADLEVKISVGPWHEIKQQLTEGRLDVLPLVAYTPERDKIYDFSTPYLQMHGTIFVRKGEKSIRSETDLKDKEVLVMRADASHEYAVRHNLSAKLILTTSFEEAMQLLSSGKHDAVLCQHLMGLQLIKKMGIKNVVSVSTKDEVSMKPGTRGVFGFDQKFCLAVPEGRKELLAHLNEGLSIVFTDGTYDKLYDKWFMPILPQPHVPLAKIIKSVLFILVPTLLLAAVVGMWYLRRKVAKNYQDLFGNMLNAFALHEIVCNEHGTPVDYRFLRVNPAFEKVTGLKAKDLIDKTVLEALPGTEKHWIDTYGKVALTGDPVSFVNFSAELGKHFEVTAYSPVKNQFACIFQDVTSRIKAEEERQVTLQRLAAILDSIEAIVYVADMNSYIVLFINKYGKNIFGDAVGTLCWQTFQKDQTGPCPFCSNQHLLNPDNRSGAYVWEMQNTRNGRWYLMRDKAIKWFDGRLVRIQIATDISDMKLAEKEKQALINKLEKALAEIKTLRGILPICSFCKKIRNDDGYYEQIEGYIHKHSGVDFSHTICPTCLIKNYPKEYDSIMQKKGE